MVDFELIEDERLVLKALKDFMEQEVLPREKKLQHILSSDRKLLTDEGLIHPEVIGAIEDVRRQSAKLGFYGMHMPEEVGGSGISRAGMLMANKLSFSYGLGLNMGVLANIEGPTNLLLELNEEQREKWLYPVMRGEKTGCFALTEPGAGSDVRGMKTTAIKDGDEYVLNGSKYFVSNGPYADFIEVFAKTDPESRGPGSISCFIVEKGADGVIESPPQDTIARDGLQCEFTFEDCRVPAENMVGGEGEGFFLAINNVDDLRLQIGGQCIGLAQHCLDKTVEYAVQREAFGRSISKFQGVSFPLADAKTRALSVETLALYAAWKMDNDESAIMETSMVKLEGTEMLWEVADTCIQAHGGVGSTEELGLERILRLARVMRIFEGTSEIQRHTVAKMMGL